MRRCENSSTLAPRLRACVSQNFERLDLKIEHSNFHSIHVGWISSWTKRLFH